MAMKTIQQLFREKGGGPLLLLRSATAIIFYTDIKVTLGLLQGTHESDNEPECEGYGQWYGVLDLQPCVTRHVPVSVPLQPMAVSFRIRQLVLLDVRTKPDCH